MVCYSTINNTSPNPPGDLSFQNIFMNSVDVNLQTRWHQYGMQPKLAPPDKENEPLPANDTLLISRPKVYPNPKVPKLRLCRTAHNPHVRVAHN